MWPIKNNPNAEYPLGSSSFEGWNNNTKVATTSEEARAWFEANTNSVISKQRKYWPVWQGKSDEDLAKRSLDIDDGV